jgi:hypothetical protein
MEFSDFSTPEKEFCCLKMKEVIQAQIYEETKNMTAEELMAYYNSEPDFEPFKSLYNQKRVAEKLKTVK